MAAALAAATMSAGIPKQSATRTWQHAPLFCCKCGATQRTSPGAAFVLQSCSHILCNSCCKPSNNGNGKVWCHIDRINVNILPINDTLPRKYLDSLFWDSAERLTEAFDHYKESVKKYSVLTDLIEDMDIPDETTIIELKKSLDEETAKCKLYDCEKAAQKLKTDLARMKQSLSSLYSGKSAATPITNGRQKPIISTDVYQTPTIIHSIEPPVLRSVLKNNRVHHGQESNNAENKISYHAVNRQSHSMATSRPDTHKRSETLVPPYIRKSNEQSTATNILLTRDKTAAKLQNDLARLKIDAKPTNPNFTPPINNRNAYMHHVRRPTIPVRSLSPAERPLPVIAAGPTDHRSAIRHASHDPRRYSSALYASIGQSKRDESLKQPVGLKELLRPKNTLNRCDYGTSVNQSLHNQRVNLSSRHHDASSSTISADRTRKFGSGLLDRMSMSGAADPLPNRYDARQTSVEPHRGLGVGAATAATPFPYRHIAQSYRTHEKIASKPKESDVIPPRIGQKVLPIAAPFRYDNRASTSTRTSIMTSTDSRQYDKSNRDAVSSRLACDRLGVPGRIALPKPVPLQAYRYSTSTCVASMLPNCPCHQCLAKRRGFVA